MTEDRQARAPFTHAIDPDPGIVVLTYTRQPTFSEWAKAMKKVLADPDYRPGLGILSDRRKVGGTADPPTVQAMADWVHAHRDRFANCRWAVVVSPDAVAEYGMARMGSMLFEPAGIELRAFTDYADAVAWVASSGLKAGV